MDNVQKWRNVTKQRMVDSMGGGCACCGYNRCNNALEFHHLNPADKLFELKTALERPKAWSTIVSELRKCVLLCANCHREVHQNFLAVEILQYFDEDYAVYLPAKAKSSCPVCGSDKPLYNKTCSSKCAGSLARKVDWDTIDVIGMIKTCGNAEQVGAALGISGAAVRKRLKKLSNMT